jgi:hypothetical protein
MAAFNPADYETVAERIKRFYSDHSDGRIITKNLTTKQDRLASTWVVQAEVYLPIWALGAGIDKAGIDYKKGYEKECWFLKATGLAFEVDGQGMANKTSALENAETSAIGRALANAGYSGDKRASREEMEKVARANAPKRDWMAEADALALVYNLDGLRKLYSEAVANRVLPEIVEKIKAYGNDLARSGDSGSEPVRGEGAA